ncbi:MAG: PilZ domain-containing protein [Gammaproteobacteria bacterium]|nr:PilZ domain-containing protein [Gammaproteobacteria bacterium]
MERREQERQEVSLTVEVLDPPHLGKVKLRTRDLNKKGAFLLLKKERCLPVGRVVSLRMPGLLWGEETSTVSARVIHVTEEGMGLQFLDFDF